LHIAGAMRSGVDIAPRFQRLAARFTEILESHAPKGTDGATEFAAGLCRRYPAGAVEIDLVERCGPRLAAVLAGTEDPLPLLFPGGDMSAIAAIYRDA